ncbi:MAG: hypothetical protein ACRCZF_21530 [Gemmataceae bacterium]
MRTLKVSNSYGSVDVRRKLAARYVHVPGPRLQPLCRKLGIRYADALVGFNERGRKARFGYKAVLDGVVVSAKSAPKLRNAIVDREQRSQHRAERAEQCQERRLAFQTARNAEADERMRLETTTSLSVRFPLLPEPIRTECIESGVKVFGPADSLPTDQYTAREWRHLGAKLRKDAKPRSYLSRRKDTSLSPLFAASVVEPSSSRRAKWVPVRLWQFWRDGFESDVVALATAVRFANRLIKLAPFSCHKREVYEVKDRFIRLACPYLRESRVSRVEERQCWDCGGHGLQGDEECYRCDGSGVYSSRTLYEHLFEIGGEEFCFHSFVQPPANHLSCAAGADLPSYGRRFAPKELPRVRLRVPEFIRLIGYALDNVTQPTASTTTPSPRSHP